MTNLDSSYKYYIIDDEVYDLAEWIPQHPGGHLWFHRLNGRDITAAIHTYHEHPKSLLKLIQKYKVKMDHEDAINPKMNVPSFVIPKDFDARTDTIKFDFHNNNQVLEDVKESLKKNKMKEKIKRADFLFDLIGFAILIIHHYMAYFGIY